MADSLAPQDVPHVMVPRLNADDVIEFELSMAKLCVRVIEPIYLTMAPIGWRLFDGYMKYHGAVDMLMRAYHPMALIPGYGMRFAHPGDQNMYFMSSPTSVITINGKPIM
jgi:hypothetical protein